MYFLSSGVKGLMLVRMVIIIAVMPITMVMITVSDNHLMVTDGIH